MTIGGNPPDCVVMRQSLAVSSIFVIKKWVNGQLKHDYERA